MQQQQAAPEGAAGEPDSGEALLEGDAGEPAGGEAPLQLGVLQENLLVEEHYWGVCRQLWHRGDVGHRWGIGGVEVSHPASVTTDSLV